MINYIQLHLQQYSSNSSFGLTNYFRCEFVLQQYLTVLFGNYCNRFYLWRRMSSCICHGTFSRETASFIPSGCDRRLVLTLWRLSCVRVRGFSTYVWSNFLSSVLCSSKCPRYFSEFSASRTSPTAFKNLNKTALLRSLIPCLPMLTHILKDETGNSRCCIAYCSPLKAAAQMPTRGHPKTL